MGSQYRIAHVGTGYTGSIALRQILRSPRLKLVGQLVHSRDKVGRDSGELVDLPTAGVIATDSLDELLALDADCVSYFAAVSGREGSCFTHPRSTTPRGTSWKPRADKGTAPCWPPGSRRDSPPMFSQCTRRA